MPSARRTDDRARVRLRHPLARERVVQIDRSHHAALRSVRSLIPPDVRVGISELQPTRRPIVSRLGAVRAARSTAICLAALGTIRAPSHLV